MLLRALSALPCNGCLFWRQPWVCTISGSLRLHRTLRTKSLHHSTSCSLKWFLKCCKVRTSNGEQEYVIIGTHFICRHQTQCHREPSKRQVKFLQKVWFPRSLCGLFINPEIFLRSLYYPEQGVCCSHAVSWKLLGGNLLGGNSRWKSEQKVLLKHFEE